MKIGRKSIFNNKKVLVSGASGFIGSHLCRALQTKGADLHGISRRKQDNAATGIRWWTGDMADLTSVRQIVQAVRPDYIFHLASHVVGARTLENVIPTFYSNLQSTVNLLTAVTEAGCRRLILVGSQEEPGPGDAVVVPSSPYAAAKWSASAYARMFHALYQTPVSIARLFMVYGPGQQDLAKLIPYVTLLLLRDEVPKLTSGTRLIDWIYIQDVVEGLQAVAQAENIDGSTCDIGSGTLVSIKDTVATLMQVMAKDIEPNFGGLPDRVMEQTRKADIQKTYKQTGWKPAISLKEGLSRTIKWYKNLTKH